MFLPHLFSDCSAPSSPDRGLCGGRMWDGGQSGLWPDMGRGPAHTRRKQRASVTVSGNFLVIDLDHADPDGLSGAEMAVGTNG